jgi:uncharacterized protein YaaQ
LPELTAGSLAVSGLPGFIMQNANVLEVSESCIEGSYEVSVEATIDGYSEKGSTTLHVLGIEADNNEEQEELKENQVL